MKYYIVNDENFKTYIIPLDKKGEWEARMLGIDHDNYDWNNKPKIPGFAIRVPATKFITFDGFELVDCEEEQEEKLLNCPFCGGPSEIVECVKEGGRGDYFTVECLDCCLRLPIESPNKKTVIEFWNSRFDCKGRVVG